MPEYIGAIAIPEITPSGTFPLVPDYPHQVTRDYRVVAHQFASSNRKIEQRYVLGTGTRTFSLTRRFMRESQRAALMSHWETNKGGYGAFTYNAPSTDQASTVAYTVRYAGEPIIIQSAGPHAWSCRVTLKEIPETASAPSYSISSTVTRFPSGGLTTALLSQQQMMIPLLKITPRQSGYTVIYLSDRRVTVGGQLYQPRLLNWDGISQSLGSASDNASFSFGNADNVFTELANDVDLVRATIEFSLLHLTAVDGSGTNTKINLWKGEVVTWEDEEANPEFKVTASDVIYDLTLPHPSMLVSRECWKKFNDGNACPYASVGSLNGSYPSASATTCDKGFFTPNGCEAHNMSRYHGGIQAEPQGVMIKNNATGTWGIGRALASSASIVNDSSYGEPLQEVYTDSEMPVQCNVVAGRDESDFYEALGVVGRGPITFQTPAGLKFHTLDGQAHHGFPGSLGLRAITGTDPAGATEFFSLDQSGNQVNGDAKKVYSGSSTYRNVFAAGVAFLVIRRGDEKGIQLSRPSEHAMTALVSGGLQGWVWSGAGSRSLTTLTNPVWIVVNMHLRGLGLQFASASVCEDYFDLTAALAAAAICDTSVAKISGLSGTETQYKFRGVIRDRKPLADWIDDVLANCLGYRTNSFGKLKIGIRNDSSAVEAFTAGNILADSLRLYPRRPSFNQITTEFNDQDYEYQRNTITVEATDHKELIGGAATPKVLPVTKQLLGTSSSSQAGRLAATLLKEELGGATLTEWRKAREVSLRTTILSLNAEPGMVCSLTHEKMPGGAGEFRITDWKLNSDMTIDINGRTTTDAMYDLTAGPKPADVTPSPVPIEQVQYPRRPGWMAGTNRGVASYPHAFQDFTIGIAEVYQTQADSSVQATVEISGIAPRNEFLDVPPPIIRTITATAGGGNTLPAGNWFASVAPYKNSGPGGSAQYGPPSNTLAIYSSAVGKITVSDITWPAAPSGSWDGYAILYGPTEQEMCRNESSGTPPTSVDATFARSFSQGLQPNALKVRGKIKLCPWPGVMRAAVSSVTSTTITCDSLAGGGDAFAGRVLLIISDASDGVMGILQYSCSSYNQALGEFTVTPDPSAQLGAGDMLVVLTAPTATSTTVSDSKWGFTTDELVGKIVRILHGTGRGQSRIISANTATQITFERAWDVNPDTTSAVVVEEADWAWPAESSDIENLSGNTIFLSVPIDNLRGAVVLCAGFMVDKFGQESPETATPMRLLFLNGEPFQETVTAATYTVPDDTRTLLFDSTANTIDATLPNPADVKGQQIQAKLVDGANTVTLIGSIDGATDLVLTDSAILYSDGVTYRTMGNGSGSGGGSNSAWVPVTLTADTTYSRTVGSAGDSFYLAVTQDATGGWVLDFSTDFELTDSVVDIGMDPGDQTLIAFISTGTKWRPKPGGTIRS